MTLVDLTRSTTRKSPTEETIPVVVRSSENIERVPLERLVTLASVIDLTRRPDASRVARGDLARTGVSGIGGVILRADWSDHYLAGDRTKPPELSVDAAAYLLEGGVRTVAADFPLTAGAADLLLHNNCVLVYALSGVAALKKQIVRLVALPLKLEDTFSADARVIAIDEQEP